MLKWHHNTHDASLWLHQHQHLFKMEVFKLPYIYMTVSAQAYQAGVEALINSLQLWVCPSFTFTTNF